MKITNVRKRQAISPVIATVILIAITLIAAIAIGGFVFGLFGSFTSSAQVISTAAIKGGGAGSTLTASCTTIPTATGTQYVTLVNSGTGSTAADLVTLTFGGNTYTAPLTAASCTIGASGSASSTLYVVLAGLTMGGSGTAYTGSVSLTNGGSPPFSGVFA